MLKVKIIAATVVAFAILAGVASMGEFLFRNPAAQHNGKDEESLTLVVKFAPEKRVKAERVYIEVYVESTRIMNEFAADSWIRVVQLAKGRKVTLMATMETGRDLHCYVKEGTDFIAQDHRVGPGDVTCGYRYEIRP